MTYSEALDTINSLLRFGIKPGLERVQGLLQELGDPQNRLRFIHVAGTNGKGTTSTLIASTLKEAGYRTGLYTSPYVSDFRERFQINGEMISKESLVEQLEKVLPAVRKMEERGETVTEFELITALALSWFAECHCDYVVLEVGLGGRFDATNVIRTPEVAVITSISLDHTAILGDTLEKIAFEKCGIIKPGGTIVLYPEQSPEVFRTVEGIAEERGARFLTADLNRIREKQASLEGSILEYDGKELRLPFIGKHQEKNAATALAALEVLQEKGAKIPWSAVERGFAGAKLPARMEILSRKPLVLMDGGHNPGCAQALANVLKTYLSGHQLIGVMGMMSDKDSRTALASLAPLFSAMITLRPENPRSLSSEELKAVADEFCGDVRAMDDQEAALQTAAELCGEDGAIIICGSFYLAGELRPLVLKKFSNTKQK